MPILFTTIVLIVCLNTSQGSYWHRSLFSGVLAMPSDNPKTVTEAKAGDVFYFDPNRMVLFYHDAEISAEYTRIGTFDATEEFVTAVEENPVPEGWGNKIIQISQP